MGEVCYKDDFAGHQPMVPPEEDFRLPPDLERDRFDDEQLVYLAEWMMEFRVECFNRLLEFLSRKGCRLRICILDKMVNRPTLKWCDAAAFYGVSQHKLFDAKREMMAELQGILRGLGLYERRMRGGRKRCFVSAKRRRKKRRKISPAQLTFDFYEQEDK